MENGNINALKGENTIPYGRVYYYYYVSVCVGGGDVEIFHCHRGYVERFH